MKKPSFAAGLAALLSILGIAANAAPAAYTYTAPGAWSWVCPAGVTSVTVACSGGGGAGGSAINGTSSTPNGAGGGGGGAYTLVSSVAVTAGHTYTVTVGAGGASSGGTSTAGGSSSFPGDSVTVTANGGSAGTSETVAGQFGAGGAGGTVSAGASFAGGAGAAAASATDGGGGGSGAGTSATGAAGSGSTGGTAPAGGASGGGGATSSGNGSAGSFPGGGGGGAYAKSGSQRSGGAGGGGQVVISVGNSFAFTPGNLAVLMPTDPSANNTSLSILEVLTNAANQSVVFSLPVDSSDSSALHFSGSASTSGFLADSGDGTLLAFTGANTTSYATAVNAIAARGVGTLTASASYALPATYTASVSPTTQPRCASTIDDVNWVFSDQGGVYTNSSSGVPSPAGNFRAVKSFGGVNYVLTASATEPAVMSYVGNNTNVLAGVQADASATDFYLVSSGQNGSAYDVLYVLQETAASSGSIYKYSLSGGTWTSNSSYPQASGGFALCAGTNISGGMNLYFTTGSGTTVGNSIIQFTDTASPLNGPISIAPASAITLFTAPALSSVKGIALAPVALAPTVTSSNATSIASSSAALNGDIVYNGGAPLTDYGFYWSTSSPVTPGSTKAQVGTGDHSGPFSYNLTGLNANTLYYYSAYANNTAGDTLGGADFNFYTLAVLPNAPTVGNPTTNSLEVAIGLPDGNPPATTYAILETTTGNYVQADGSLAATAVFETALTWGTMTVTGLNSASTYTFEVEAENGANVLAGFSPTASGTTSTPPTPTITVVPLSLSFPATIVGGASASEHYAVSGTNLVASIIITAPGGFVISTNIVSGYGGSVTLPESGGTVATTPVYVRFQPAAETSYSGNITDTSTSANNPPVAVSGLGALAPSVSTQAANPIATNSATLNGMVVSSNNAAITDAGFYWSASPSVNNTDTYLDVGGTSAGAFSNSLAGLSPNTIYYYRAYAANTVGSTLGSADVSFYTLANTPVAPVVTSPTTNSLSVTIGSGDSNPASTQYAIYVGNVAEYVQPGGTLGASAVFQTSVVWGATTVSGLALGTNYDFEVEAENGADVVTAFGPVAVGNTANVPYTPDNIAILSADVASANNTAFTILEVNPVTSTLVQTIPINGTSGGDALRVSGSAGSAPKLANSGDGTLLVMAAFNSTNTTVTANTITNRAVATLDALNNFVFQTTYIGISSNQVRSATTPDDKTWYVADAGGIYTNGRTAPLNTGSIGAIKSFGGTVYAMETGSGTIVVSTVSGDGITLTGLPGLARDKNAVDFYMVSSGNNGSAYDLLYVLDETTATAGVITKYSLVAGSWVTSGTAPTGVGGYGLAAALAGNSGVNLYFTSGDGTVADNALYQATDSAGWNQGPSISTPTLIYTATGTATLKGVAFAPANPIVVTTAADSGAGSLRTAIASAYSGAVIKFASNLSGSTILLESTLTVNTNLTIDASALPGGIQISGQYAAEVFNVEANNEVVLNTLTITAGDGGEGGGIHNDGTLTLNQCTLSAQNAGVGGGIYNDTSSVLTLNQCTLSGNIAAGGTGGGGIYNDGTLTVSQSTVSANTAASDFGNGIYNDSGGTLTLSNSIVAGNDASDLYNMGTVNFNGVNVIQYFDNDGSANGSPIIQGQAQPLAPLGNYGGPTQTMPPVPGSVATGACSTTLATDQRGFPRVNPSATDIGAVGFDYNPAGPGSLGNPTYPAMGEFTLTLTNYTYMSFTVRATNNLGVPTSTWTILGTATETPFASGQYKFSDPNSSSYTERYYNVTSP